MISGMAILNKLLKQLEHVLILIKAIPDFIRKFTRNSIKFPRYKFLKTKIVSLIFSRVNEEILIFLKDRND